MSKKSKIVPMDRNKRGIVEALKYAVAEAEKGDVISVALVLCNKDESVTTYATHDQFPFLLIGGLEEIKYRTLAEGIER